MIIDRRQINFQAPRRGLMKYPHTPTEFDVQAYLWTQLRLAGFDVHGEVTCHSSRARLDLVIFDLKRNPARVIEVKRRKHNGKPGTNCGEQIGGYYSDFGVPVDFVCGMKQARQYLARIVPHIDYLKCSTSLPPDSPARPLNNP